MEVTTGEGDGGGVWTELIAFATSVGVVDGKSDAAADVEGTRVAIAAMRCCSSTVSASVAKRQETHSGMKHASEKSSHETEPFNATDRDCSN